MAVEINEDVRDMVEQELRANPDMSTKDLKLKAEEIDSDVEDLSVRQFNARYPLQVKRKLAAVEEKQDDGEPAEEPETSEDPEAEVTEDEETGDEPDEDKREDILAMIEEVLRENPDASNEELQERAAEIDPAVGELDARSFNARYPLQVKRKLSAERKEEQEEEAEAAETEPSAEETEAEELRPAVRQALLDFAKAVAGAEDRGAVIDVLTSVDDYVDQALKSE